MQHVAFDKLPAGVTENLGPRQIGPMVHEGGRVLKLVSKAEGPSGLVIRRPAPHSAT